MFPTGTERVVRIALRALGVRNLVLGIHDPAFPGLPGDDVGRGSPYSRGAEQLFQLAAELGFSGVQLGPQGQTSLINPSPYDGTIFSRSVLSIALRELCEPAQGPPLLSAATLAALASGVPVESTAGKVPYRYAFVEQHRALAEAFANFERLGERGAHRKLQEFERHHAAWLDRDALYQILTEVHGGLGFRHWFDPSGPHSDQNLWAPPAGQEEACEARRQQLLRDHRRSALAYAFSQMLVHEQHVALRARCRSLGLDLLGDLQVGLANQDVFSYCPLILRDYVMGAPPSRTTPTGQVQPKISRMMNSEMMLGGKMAERISRI